MLRIVGLAVDVQHSFHRRNKFGAGLRGSHPAVFKGLTSFFQRLSHRLMGQSVHQFELGQQLRLQAAISLQTVLALRGLAVQAQTQAFKDKLLFRPVRLGAH